MNKWIPIDISYDEFEDQKLNKPGTFIRVGGKVYLIGDINRARGICDDCTEFRSSEIVSEYQPPIDYPT